MLVAFVMIPFDRRGLDCAVHPSDLAIGPWMIGFGQSVFNLICFADHVEAHRPGICVVSVSGQVCNLDTVVGNNVVKFVGNGFQKVLKERPFCFAIYSVGKFRKGELAGAIEARDRCIVALTACVVVALP